MSHLGHRTKLKISLNEFREPMAHHVYSDKLCVEVDIIMFVLHVLYQNLSYPLTLLLPLDLSILIIWISQFSNERGFWWIFSFPPIIYLFIYLYIFDSINIEILISKECRPV